jgi:enediyne biosynthesis protein E4
VSTRRRRRRPGRGAIRFGCGFAALLLLHGCADVTAEDRERNAAERDTVVAPAPLFVERAAELGIDFFHFSGSTGDYHMAEISGAGAALFDYDGDGDLDVYLVQGAPLEPGDELADALVPPRHPAPLSDRLYRNDMVAGDPSSLRFTDVTEASGLAALARGYGMGVAIGDFDGDGAPDIYLTNLGGNQLLRNRGDGTFEDVTAAAGVGEERWSVPATFFDFDRDGWLDLFVGNYLDFDASTALRCVDSAGARDYCGPHNFEPLPDRLFRNRGDGTFEDVTVAAGLRAGFGPALGAVAVDLDGDGWLDLYVANDGTANNLWMGLGGGRFEDRALISGAAVDAAGRPQASMGIDAGDFDGDGRLDLFMTHLIGETNTLYGNLGGGLFADVTVGSGLGGPSRLHTGFGTVFIDYDNDGWEDVFVANGAVKKLESLARAGEPFPFHEPNQLFRNENGRGFVEVTVAEAGSVFALSEVSRGVAVGDVDNDGALDLLIANNSGPARLLLNQRGASRWIGFHLRTAAGGEAHGATVELLTQGRTLLRRVRIDGSYASTNDPRVSFGLGDHLVPRVVRVRWPDGSVEESVAPAIGRYHVLRQGGGTARAP